MRATCLLFLMIDYAALMPGTSYAAQSNPASQQRSSESLANTISDHPRDAVHGVPFEDGENQKQGETSDEQRDHHYASDGNHSRSRASLTKANRPKQLPNGRKGSIPGNAMNLHQPDSAKSGGAAKDGLIRNETVNIALPVRPPVVRRTVPSLNNARHRGANPAVIGGSAKSDSRNSGEISGTRMIRRP